MRAVESSVSRDGLTTPRVTDTTDELTGDEAIRLQPWRNLSSSPVDRRPLGSHGTAGWSSWSRRSRKGWNLIMGHITKRSGHYRARWLDPDGRERSRTFSRKADAERHLTAVEGASLRRIHRPRVEDHAGRICTGVGSDATPSADHRSAYGLPDQQAHCWDQNRRQAALHAPCASELQGWVAERSQILAPSTLRLVAGVLRSILSSAVQDRLIASSPAARLSLPRSKRERVVPLSTVQVQALADAMPERCRAMVIAQAGLGLRIGELMALRVTDINFLARTARIDWQTSPDGKQRVAPKTPRSRRTLPLPNMVAEALAQHIAAFPRSTGCYSQRSTATRGDTSTTALGSSLPP